MLLPFLVYSIKNFSCIISKITFFITVYFLHFFKGLNIYFVKGLGYFEVKKEIINFFDYSISYINILFLLLILILNLTNKNLIKD